MRSADTTAARFCESCGAALWDGSEERRKVVTESRALVAAIPEGADVETSVVSIAEVTRALRVAGLVAETEVDDLSLAVDASGADRPTAIRLDDVVAEQHAARRDRLA